jgi:hypothetical protein
MLKTLDIELELLPYLQQSPVGPAECQQRAVSNDAATIENWRNIWIGNAKKNHEKYGPFKDSHVGQFYNLLNQKPCIVLGSGPSLANSIPALKDNKDVFVISCLHNFHYLIDNDIKVDLWVSLDAGPVTIEEISEGGKHNHDYYLEKTKHEKLALYISSDPGLVESWKGEKYWFSCGIPDDKIRNEMESIEKFQVYVSNGGNVLGGCMYIARGFMGANPICFGGADFAFGYKKQFHSWGSKYDSKLGRVLRAHDIYGLPVYTWTSYNNFKLWFEGVSQRCPGLWINASEGGTLGSYYNGLIPSIKQMTMKDFLLMYNIHKELKYMCDHPEDATEPGMQLPKVLF